MSVNTNRQPAGVPSGGQFAAGSTAEAEVGLDPTTDWRDQPVVVMGRRFTLGQVRGGRFYHGTSAQLGPDDELWPGVGPANFAESDASAVSITSDPAVAEMWARRAAANQGLDPEQAVVYEVEPAADLEPWRVALAERGTSFDVLEARASSATVLSPAQQ